MNKEEIIELAREAGVRDDENIFEFSQYKYLEAFAKLVLEKEREACAKLIESHGETLANGFMLTEAIRERGQDA